MTPHFRGPLPDQVAAALEASRREAETDEDAMRRVLELSRREVGGRGSEANGQALSGGMRGGGTHDGRSVEVPIELSDGSDAATDVDEGEHACS